MKKKVQSLLVVAFISGAGFAQQMNSDAVPFNGEAAPSTYFGQTSNSKALWDVELDADPTATTVSLAGCFWTGSEFWVTQWNTDSLFILDATGTYVSDFQIPGITGARSVTSDGTSHYIGAAGAQIYQVDPGTMTVVSTINTSGLNCRYVTYDPTLDGGAGGFWTGQYADDITAVSMSGATLSTISAATHGMTGIYGLAYDDYSYGGPYLWAYDQGGAGTSALIVQLDMSGNQTGELHDTQVDLAGGNTGIAGGLFFTTAWPGEAGAIGGLNQGTSVFVYEATTPFGTGVEENEGINMAVYPNPANTNLTVNVPNEVVELIHVYGIDGQLVMSEKIGSAGSINTIDVSELPEGVYVIEVQTANGIANQRFIKS